MSSKPSKSTSSSKTKSSSKKVAAPAKAKKAKKTDVVVEAAKAVVVEQPAVEVKDVPVMAAPTRTVSRAEFLDLVRKEAYQRAARRNFKNGSPFQDWVHAEAHVSGQLASQGVQLS